LSLKDIELKMIKWLEKQDRAKTQTLNDKINTLETELKISLSKVQEKNLEAKDYLFLVRDL